MKIDQDVLNAIAKALRTLEDGSIRRVELETHNVKMVGYWIGAGQIRIDIISKGG